MNKISCYKKCFILYHITSLNLIFYHLTAVLTYRILIIRKSIKKRLFLKLSDVKRIRPLRRSF